MIRRNNSGRCRVKLASSGKKAAWRLGVRAEWLAMFILMCKGYKIVGHRLRTPLGELDIIARRGQHFAFVEVKARRKYEAHGEILTHRSMERIRGAADFWLARQGAQGRLREGWTASLDVVFLFPWRLPVHIQSAF